MVVLLGFAAIAVDVGMLYAERTQLRNGADAAALAIAQKCAKNVNDADCSTTSTLARSLANSNAGDGAQQHASLVLDKAAGTVKVTAGAQEAGKAPNQVSLFFARALGFNDAEVTAGSTVRWGSPVAGPTPFPLAFSICQVQGHVDGEPAAAAEPRQQRQRRLHVRAVRSRRSGRLRLAHAAIRARAAASIDIAIRRRRQRSRQQLPRRICDAPAATGQRTSPPARTSSSCCRSSTG